MEKLQKRNLTLVIVLAGVFVIAAGVAVYFLVGALQADEAITVIDQTAYEIVAENKGAQHEQNGEPLTAEITESLEYSVYNTPLGFPIISYSENWTDDKLIDVYDELLKNKHGNELGYITKIELYPDNAGYSLTMDAAGDRTDGEVFDKYVYVDVPALIPPKLWYDTDLVVSEITLYYMENYDDASEVAAVLAHEYGHHYTMFYFMQDDEAVRESEYYTLRDADSFGHEVFFNTAQFYYENYMWDIYEIAANDYVQLMGSPNARQTKEYMDNMDLIVQGVSSPKSEYRAEYWNVFPQDNIFIPLADEVDGLGDYLGSFIEVQNEYDTPVESFDFHLQIERHSHYGHEYYTITWTMDSIDPDALYTLVCYDTSGNLFRAVRTVYGDEEPIAYVGEIVARHGNWITGWDDHINDGDRIFKLYLLLPDGRMIASEPFYVDF